jgi:hypothetical protein
LQKRIEANQIETAIGQNRKNITAYPEAIIWSEPMFKKRFSPIFFIPKLPQELRDLFCKSLIHKRFTRTEPSTPQECRLISVHNQISFE